MDPLNQIVLIFRPPHFFVYKKNEKKKKKLELIFLSRGFQFSIERVDMHDPSIL